MLTQKTHYNEDVDIVYNGIVYLIVVDGETKAFAYTMSEANLYAEEYAGYKGRPLEK